MAVERLISFLDQNHTEYKRLKHEKAYSALESAENAHISKNKMVKSVLLKLDGIHNLIVLPSNKKIDLKKLKEVTGSHNIELSVEEEIESIFPDCMTGAIPPLGNLYQIPVITDSLITEQDDIFFEPGSHREILKIAISDYIKLTHPRIAEIHKNN